jgi:hypothetical protein
MHTVFDPAKPATGHQLRHRPANFDTPNRVAQELSVSTKGTPWIGFRPFKLPLAKAVS